MKRIIPLLAISLLFLQGQNPTDYSKLLPGVVKVTDYLYYDALEVTNLNWLEYMNHVKANHGGAGSAAYEAVIPDTSVWISKLPNGLPYSKLYLRHEAYMGYPVVGISWHQAQSYCTWRTARVREALEANGKLDEAPYMFNYRLPTYEEWLLVYEDVAKLSMIIGEEGKRKFRGLNRFNMHHPGGINTAEAGKLNDNADITAPSKSYWPNVYGIYNLKGNVSEWLLEKNHHVGGAWSTDEAHDVSVKQTLKSASPDVGFRCVCEVAESAH